MKVGKVSISKTLNSVETLLREDKTASLQMRAMIELLVIVIHLLLGKLGLNSKNSSTPPSKDPNRQRGSKRKVRGEKRKPGGQNGHEGTNLKKEESPDRVETLEIDRRTLPSGQYTRMGFESRQVIDIEINRLVTEFRAEILEDAKGNRFVAEFPVGVTRPVQYGDSVKAQAVYMSQFQLVPYERIRDHFEDQCGISISGGSLVNFNMEAYILLERFETLVKTNLLMQGVLNADETGINIGGKGHWLHSVSNEKWTLFFPHAKRGGEAIKAMGVLEHYRGILCHDHWKPYFQLQCEHVLCNAHHLRELERAWEQDGQRWAKTMQDLLKEMNNATKEAGGSLPGAVETTYRERYRNILAEADTECPPPDPKDRQGKRGRIAKTKSRNLLERLREFENETLRFMSDKRVPFTNNQGENDLRMTKVQQKISGCFRALEGAQIFCRVRSYLSTCRKNGVAVTDALKILFEGKLPEFMDGGG